MSLPDNPLPPHVADVLRDSIEVRLPTPDDFLKVKETLTRIGVASKRGKVLYQSCHILHKQRHYYILHYKQLFLLDGKFNQTDYTENDRARTNTIANCLAQWGLVELIEPSKSVHPVVPFVELSVIPFRVKHEWQLVAKYSIGKKFPHVQRDNERC